jgi:hypothetical protein
MGKIKSAFELAMEKAERLGELSQEELKELKEKDHQEAGEKLAQKYLKQSHYQSRELKIDIDKHEEKAREAVILAFLRQMSQLLSLESYQRPLQGILELRKDRETEQACREIEELCHQYQRAEQEMRIELQDGLTAAKMRELAEMGISGSAIKMPDVESSTKWIRARDKLLARFERELEQRKQGLNTAISGKASDK